MGMTFYTRGLALDSRHPRFIPLRIADRRPRLVATTAASLSPVVVYHGLAHRHLMLPDLLMRPLLNGGTLGGLLSLEPISRLAGSVRNRNHIDPIGQLAIEHDVREALHHELPESRVVLPS